MKKITILAAFALMTTAAFAQTEQTKRQVFYPGNNADNVYNWAGNWTPQEDLITDPFAAGDYRADRISLFVDSVTLAKPEEKEFTIDFNEVGAETPGIEITADSVRYNIQRSDISNKMTGAGDGVQLVKDGEGAFYTDVDLENMTTVLKNGTLGRYKKSSAEYKVFGDKIDVPANTKATLVMSDEDSRDYYYPSLNVDSLVIGNDAELDLYLSSYSKMRADTNVYVAGKGTINFYTRGSRFFTGGNKNCKVEAPGKDYRFNDPEDKPSAWYQKAKDKWSAVSKWEDYPTDFSGFTGTITIQNNMEVNDSTPGLFILGAGRDAQALLKNGGIYDAWKAAEFGDNESAELLNRYSLDWRNVDLVIDNLGCLSTGSAGGGTNLLRVGSLNVKEKGLVAGWYKVSNPELVIMAGGNDEDARIDGTFTAALKGNAARVQDHGAGLIKEGHGTYRITAKDNRFTCGIDVYQGGVMFNNPDPENSSATGQAFWSDVVVTCREYGRIGGTGTIGGTTDLYGTLYPGDETVSAFRIDGSHGGEMYYEIGPNDGITTNLANGNKYFHVITEKVDNQDVPKDTVYERGAGSKADLYLHNGAAIVFDVNSKDSHDTLLVQRDIYLKDPRNNEKKVKISLTPRGEFNLAENDTIVLMTAPRAVLYDNINMKDMLTEKDFELVVSPEYGDAKFELGTRVDTTWQIEWNDDYLEWDSTFISRSWELVAVATSAGSGGFTPAAIQEPETETMQVYPNPAVDNVTVALPADVTGTVAIYNLSGQLVKSVSTTEPAVTVNVDDLTAGVYTVRVQTADKSYVQRLVVK